MNSEFENLLCFASKNLNFAIGAFMSSNKNVKLKDILKFTEEFISEQIDDFGNWGDDVWNRPSEDEVDEHKEDNPT
jgi:hypothetical protein